MRPSTTITTFLLCFLAACNGPDDSDDAEDTDLTGDTDPTGDTDDTDTDLPDPLALNGDWADFWGTWHTITDTVWTQTYDGGSPSTFEITQYANDERFVIAQNGATNEYNPGAFSRFDWAEVDGDFHYCQTAYAAASEADALATPAADGTDLMGGCGGFPWTPLMVPLDIRGSWTDNWGGSHEIDELAWVSGSSVYHVTAYDNAAGVVIAQNDADNEWNAGLWSRIDWSVSGADLWFCQTAYDAASEEAAESTAPADASDLATGCGGFGWSSLLPVE